MTITINGGSQVRQEGTFQSKEDLTQSTATSRQSISLRTPVTTFSGGTATGFGVDLYTLADGNEGDEKVIVMLATGEAKMVFTTMATGVHYIGKDTAGIATATGYAGMISGAATGALTFTTAHQYVRCKFFNGGWNILGGQATFATAT